MYVRFNDTNMDLGVKRSLLNTLVLEAKIFSCGLVPADFHDTDGLLSRIQVTANDLPDYRDSSTGEVSWDHIHHTFLLALERSHTCFLIAFNTAYEKNREKSKDLSVRDAEKESFDLQLFMQTVDQLTHDAISHVRRFGLVPFTTKVAPLNSAPHASSSSAHYGPQVSPSSTKSLTKRPEVLRHAMSGITAFPSDERQLQFEQDEAVEYALSLTTSGPRSEPAGTNHGDQEHYEQIAFASSLIDSTPAERRCQCCGVPSSIDDHGSDKCPIRNPKDRERLSVSIFRLAEMKDLPRAVFLDFIEKYGAFAHRNEDQKSRFREALARTVAQVAENNRVKRGQYSTGSQYSSSNGGRPSNHYSQSAPPLPPGPPPAQTAPSSQSAPAPLSTVPGYTPVHPSRDARISRNG